MSLADLGVSEHQDWGAATAPHVAAAQPQHLTGAQVAMECHIRQSRQLWHLPLNGRAAYEKETRDREWPSLLRRLKLAPRPENLPRARHDTFYVVVPLET